MRLHFYVFSMIIIKCLNASADIQFKGILSEDAIQIKKMYPTILNNPPDLHSLDEAIRYLTNIESYSEIELHELQNDQYLIAAVPLKKMGDVTIVGNKKVDTDEALTVLGFKKGAKFDSNKIYEAGERLKEYYGRRGFFNTIVSFNFTPGKDNELNVNIGIKERDPCVIKEITINTENKILKEKLEKRIKKFLKKNFTEESTVDIESEVNEYLKDERYLNARFEQKSARYMNNKTGVALNYDLLMPYTYELIISGNKSFSSSKIISNIKLDEIIQGSHDLTEDIALLIRHFYISNGFAHFRMNSYDKTIENLFLKKLYYEIDEGPQVEIQNIEVIGRISRPSSFYSGFIFNNSSPMIEDKVYVKNDLDLGLKNLITSLNNEGYLKAKIQSTRIDYSDKKNKATIIIVLDEGPLTQLSKIAFTGISSFTEFQLLDQLKIKTQSPLRLNELEESIANLKQFYLERGFIEMKLLNEDETLVEYDERGLTASVTFKVFEGPQVFIKSIVIEGNSFTKDYVISRELGFEIGDLVTPEGLDEAQKRLDKLTIFSRIEIKTLEANTNVSQRTLVVSVTEKNPGLFKIGAGLNNRRGLTARGFAGLSYNNIAGTARAVSLRGTIENNLVSQNRLEYETSISYLEPFIFQKRIRGRATYLHSDKITEGGASSTDILDSKDSVNFTLEKDITSKIKFSWLTWGFDSNEQSSLPDSGPARRLSRLDIGYLGPTLDIEYRDNPFLPTQGFFMKLDTIYSDPAIASSRDVQFVRSQATASHYLKLGASKWVWANSVSGGYEKNLNNRASSAVPASFAFFLGGVSTVRGYSGSLTDRIPNNTEFPQINQLAVKTESVFQLYKSEIRFPIWGIVGGVVFYDAGRVDIQGFDFKLPFRQSYGVGVRINTPVGPIVLDYGKKIDKLDYESWDAFHFSIGTF